MSTSTKLFSNIDQQVGKRSVARRNRPGARRLGHTRAAAVAAVAASTAVVAAEHHHTTGTKARPAHRHRKIERHRRSEQQQQQPWLQVPHCYRPPPRQGLDRNQCWTVLRNHQRRLGQSQCRRQKNESKRSVETETDKTDHSQWTSDHTAVDQIAERVELIVDTRKGLVKW